MVLKKGNDVLHGETRNGKFIGTIKINGRFVTNPTLQQLTNDGWVEYIPTPQTHTPTYKERVVELVRQSYDIDDELAILRQKDTKPNEFSQYNAFVEQCRQQARNELQQQNNQ